MVVRLATQKSISMAAPTDCDLARQLQAKFARTRDQLLIFCDYLGSGRHQQCLGAKAQALADHLLILQAV
jgi:hypothetical protein